MNEMAVGHHSIGLNCTVKIVVMNGKGYSHEHILGPFDDVWSDAHEIRPIESFQ